MNSFAIDIVSKNAKVNIANVFIYACDLPIIINTKQPIFKDEMLLRF